MTPTIADLLADVQALDAKSATLSAAAGEKAAKTAALATAQADADTAAAAFAGAADDVEAARAKLIADATAFVAAGAVPPVMFAAAPGPVGKLGDGELLKKLRKLFELIGPFLPLILADEKPKAA